MAAQEIFALLYAPPVTIKENGLQPQLVHLDSAGNVRGVVDHNGYPTSRNSEFHDEWHYPTQAKIGFPTDGTAHNLAILGSRWNGITTQATASGAGIADPTAAFPARQLFLSGFGDVAVGGTAIYSAGPILPMSAAFLSVVFFWEMFANAGGDQNSQWFCGLGNRPNAQDIPGTASAIGFFRQKTDLNWQALTCRRPGGAEITNTNVVIDASTLQCKVWVTGPGLPGGPRVRFYLNDNLVATQGTFYPTDVLSWINQINCVQNGINNTGQFNVGPIRMIWNRQLSLSTT